MAQRAGSSLLDGLFEGHCHLMAVVFRKWIGLFTFPNTKLRDLIFCGYAPVQSGLTAWCCHRSGLGWRRTRSTSSDHSEMFDRTADLCKRPQRSTVSCCQRLRLYVVPRLWRMKALIFRWFLQSLKGCLGNSSFFCYMPSSNLFPSLITSPAIPGITPAGFVLSLAACAPRVRGDIGTSDAFRGKAP